ncbi:hypothetical protein [Mesorhizobium opportunistum]|uniref:Uncharacterized protein n=1 Tax=Mesorhizobium opportunistum (strain LMG 24607 / HAMBI 3007 / WSM2075) TaxID=536019 RepID=F7Y1B4_MESOW|nr:hypothetical protein [Mesorhizobium opportunistum]AEH89399.1 hypothetical protein Mesop_4979 [Mesorhizobium opportunistum WSM2075]
MSSVQHWVGVAGLCCDFYGVLLLTKEWPFMFGRGLTRLADKVGVRNVRRAEKIQAKFEKLTADRRRNEHKIFDWTYRLAQSALRLESRREAWAIKRQVTGPAGSVVGADLDIIDPNGLLDPIAVKRLGASIHGFLEDLVENGEARDLSGKGLKWVLVGLTGQLIGTLPLGL